MVRLRRRLELGGRPQLELAGIDREVLAQEPRPVQDLGIVGDREDPLRAPLEQPVGEAALAAAQVERHALVVERQSVERVGLDRGLAHPGDLPGQRIAGLGVEPGCQLPRVLPGAGVQLPGQLGLDPRAGEGLAPAGFRIRLPIRLRRQCLCGSCLVSRSHTQVVSAAAP